MKFNFKTTYTCTVLLKNLFNCVVTLKTHTGKDIIFEVADEKYLSYLSFEDLGTTVSCSSKFNSIDRSFGLTQIFVLIPESQKFDFKIENATVSQYKGKFITHLSQPLTNNFNLLSSSRAVFNALT
jgi:hypothetical protein